ncbi:LLM class F420-dependent oxidoreductase [Rhizorhapis sp. SPR117]|uniref:LLM class F420-dependent oxidoreductase n=1 Tax=Rhizorhapis sp. SPR117 TaxID=2912611 RepID=UPI001F028B4E|nr:LLM class F420-dependent oxidoreductase [Rhizorhapis sp. SPR117]
MKVGLFIGYSGAQMALPIRRIQRAEELGFDSVWTAESYGSDDMTPLAHIGALTKKIKLATGVCQLAARTPSNLAMCAQTIDGMSGKGRMILGLGVSGPQIVEGWYGQPWGKPANRIRDTVEIVRKILGREGSVTHDGNEISLPYNGPGATGLGKPLKSILHGNPDIPIMLGTSTKENIKLTAEIADGWVSMSWHPNALERFKPYLEEGFARRADKRTLKDFQIAAIVDTFISEDVASAMKAAKEPVALYVGGMGAKSKNYHKDKMVDAGFGEAAERVQELFLAGHKEEAAQAVPDEYVDRIALIGSESRIRQKWKDWEASGLDTLALALPNDESVEVVGKILRES